MKSLSISSSLLFPAFMIGSVFVIRNQVYLSHFFKRKFSHFRQIQRGFLFKEPTINFFDSFTSKKLVGNHTFKSYTDVKNDHTPKMEDLENDFVNVSGKDQICSVDTNKFNTNGMIMAKQNCTDYTSNDFKKLNAKQPIFKSSIVYKSYAGLKEIKNPFYDYRIRHDDIKEANLKKELISDNGSWKRSSSTMSKDSNFHYQKYQEESHESKFFQYKFLLWISLIPMFLLAEIFE